MPRRSFLWPDTRVKPPFGSVELDPNHALTPGLAGAWLMAEGAGAAVRDISPKQITGSSTTFPWTTTAVGPGRAISSTGDEISLGNVAAIQNDVFSIAARLVMTGTSGYRAFWGSVSGNPPEIRVDAGGNTITLLKQGIVGIGTSSGGLTAGVVSDVLVTYDAAGTVRFYIQGAASGTGSTLISFQTGQTMVIGRSPDGMFVGTVIHQFYWGNRVLTAQDAVELSGEPYAFLRPLLRRRYFMPAGAPAGGLNWKLAGGRPSLAGRGGLAA